VLPIIIIAKGHGFRDIPWRKIEWGVNIFLSLKESKLRALSLRASPVLIHSSRYRHSFNLTWKLWQVMVD
jgi:hypothetical protein